MVGSIYWSEGGVFGGVKRRVPDLATFDPTLPRTLRRFGTLTPPFFEKRAPMLFTPVLRLDFYH